MRIEDYGKVAATFVDTGTGQAVRIVPRVEARRLACEYAPKALNNWEAQLLGYQHMPAKTLLSFQSVHLKVPFERIISQPGRRVSCESCGEEIMNEREMVRDGMMLCKSCAGQGYYSVVTEFALPIAPLAKSVEAV